MSSSDLAISVRGLSKAYTIRHQAEHHITLAEQLLDRARHPFSRQERETFWAVQDVSFDVPKGEVLGVIGRNGAGKSTLLKLLSRITPPTKGEIRLYGRIGSLLEVGTGFHPELTGRENVYLNGAILGMRTKEIDRRFDEIVAFAGVERFLDTPVKRFSSGMYVRLAFAVAAHLDTEILLVDEVLSVGDSEFQKRCLAKMGSLGDEGRAVIYVSHQLDSVAALCTRALRISDGHLVQDGPPEELISSYLATLGSGPADLGTRTRTGSGHWRLSKVESLSAETRVGEPVRIAIEAESETLQALTVWPSIHVRDSVTGVLLAHCDGRLVGAGVDGVDHRSGAWLFELRSPWLKPGDYLVDVVLCSNEILDYLDAACTVRVLPYAVHHAIRTLEPNHGPTVSDFSMVAADSSSGVAAPRSNTSAI
ncbi:MAG: ATP-binding cassette protein [Actinomycetia bacterium]|nr:ATP-binding cassette protein [Actinomycetes bacterium]